MTQFEQVVGLVIGFEGGFSNDPADPGNWTGGRCQSGTLRGTKYGISAAAYPGIDIQALDPDGARAIYRRDYWDRVAGDDLPPPLAFLAFDAAVNTGVARASGWLQQAAGVSADGRVGPATLAALAARAERDGGAALCAEFLARRLLFMSNLPTWRHFGPGWARRLARLPYDSMRVTNSGDH